MSRRDEKEQVIAAVAHRRDNNFDALRLFAASAVLIAHSYPLAGRDEPFEAQTGISLGAIGVALFFGMSGFLITKSWDAEPVLRLFARKRAFRIVPALWVVLACSTMLLGPLMTSLDLPTYFKSLDTYRYAATNGVVVLNEWSLPGVFASNPSKGVVNGSLWTLPAEIAAYMMVALIGAFGLLKRRSLLIALLAGGIVLSYLVPQIGLAPQLGLLPYFITGICLYAFRDLVPLSRVAAVTLTAALVISLNTPWTPVIATIALPYLALIFAYNTPKWFNSIARPGDVSYGLYIWAFPVQQTIVHLLGDAATPGKVMLYAGSVTYILALLSWKFIERPVMRYNRSAMRRARAGRTAMSEPAAGVASS